MTTQVEFENVSKRFGDAIAVRDVSFAIPKGTLTTLLGPSGCGKTTTLRMIAGLELADAGRIRIGGRDVTRLSAVERNVAMVFQNYALFPHMSVLDNVAYGLVVGGKPKRAAHAQARAALRTVELDAYDARLPAELSGGQQQRVAVARSLVLEPDVLLFDEPLSNLDMQLRRAMRAEIRLLQQRLGLTVVYVTHDQSEAMAISDHIIVMHQGRIAQGGPPRLLYRAPRSEFVAQFMGDCNLVDGVLLGVDGSASRVQLGDLELRLPPSECAPGPVRLAIRPEGVRLGANDGAGLPAVVQSVTYLGSIVEIKLETGLGAWLALAVGPQDGYRPGLSIKVSLDPECVAVLPRL